MGDVLTCYDAAIWTARVNKENPVHAKVVTDGFAMRSAIKVPQNPVPPHRWKPQDVGTLDFAAIGWDPNGKHANEVRAILHHKQSRPRDRRPFLETASAEPGFLQSIPNMQAGLHRSTSLPGKLQPITQYEGLSAALQANTEKRHKKRERWLEEIESRLTERYENNKKFLNNGAIGAKHFAGRPKTDATAFDDHFIKVNCGVTLTQTRPSDKPTLKCANGLIAAPWSP
eukprot:CAMPEP_0206467728 /NCGR_PEP_ID=MMETSP0324_2-20121206/29206_1 /ASSEMBLY_ACC=CAM_ASM_000836 /TAXON_ID=2866 /ORGANISM="Crypthecodinium cohnii, Strain Seligo" /LENGTH=227 /DNA_ID=CAMNT_0053941049 /DNA_START=194 /DNA_END=877 /DNA_ORIENTATION=-